MAETRLTPTTEVLGLLAAAIGESRQLSAFWFSLLCLLFHTPPAVPHPTQNRYNFAHHILPSRQKNTDNDEGLGTGDWGMGEDLQ